MTRVMHISSSLQHGGIEKLIYNFTARLDREKYHVSACALDADGVYGDQIRKAGGQVSILKKRQGIDPRLWPRLYRLFRTEKVDIVHTHNFSPFFYAAIPARLAGVKALIHTEHARTAFPDVKRRMVAERCLSFFADRFTAVSPQVKRDLIHHEKISPEKIQMIWNGIETVLPPVGRQPEQIRRDFGISITAPVVGVCCRLMAQKGVRYLLEAAPAILKDHPEAVFLIVGDGDLRVGLQELAETLGVGKHVLFTGFRSDVNDLLGAFDVYVLPSVFEGTPLGLLEAMLLSKCVVVTKVGSNAEIVQDDVSGKLVEPTRPDQLSDAVCRLLSNPEKREDMGWNARERVLELFSLDRMINEYEMLYESLVSSKTAVTSFGIQCRSQHSE
jgi:glycosyltransferase involved in cell wall biosynthesis